LIIQSLRLWVTIKPIATPVLWILGISAAVGALATYFTTTTIAAAIFNVVFLLVTLIAVCLVISKERNRALQVEQRNSELFHIVSENIHNAHHLIRDALFDPNTQTQELLEKGQKIPPKIWSTCWRVYCPSLLVVMFACVSRFRNNLKVSQQGQSTIWKVKTS
jgi:hypothetical protein